jgi:hypothetical protein
MMRVDRRSHAGTRAGCALALMIVCASCSKRETEATSNSGAAAVAPVAPPPLAHPEMNPDPGGAPTMKLLDRGNPPRRRLRYAWRLGQTEALTMDLRTSATTEEGDAMQPEIQLPPVHVVLAIRPQNVSPEGDLAYAWRVTSTTVAAAPETPSSLAEGMRAEVAAIAHLSGTADVTSRGLAKGVTFDLASFADASATGQMVEQIRQTLRDIAAPFPEEEVGAGARWEKLSQLASRDERITQSETFTLVDLGDAGDHGSLDDMLAQTAPPQPLLGSGGPSGGQARIESMLASGDGKTHFELSRLVPQTKFEGTTTMVVSGHSREDDARRMTMIMRVGIVLAGSTP